MTDTEMVPYTVGSNPRSSRYSIDGQAVRVYTPSIRLFIVGAGILHKHWYPWRRQ